MEGVAVAGGEVPKGTQARYQRLGHLGTGQVLLPRYDTDSSLPQFGVVFSAKDVVTGVVYAVKKVSQQQAGRAYSIRSKWETLKTRKKVRLHARKLCYV